ncbi:hypothetical protein Tco_1043912 [Tanacetum coccineum]|uniref:Uncharacterized protein n=1 Tax=Tanacetum coccineum TaxID=301880 RepID=A0ABQ5GQE5_9ASTR
MVTSMGIRHSKANTLRGAPFDGTMAEFNNHPETLRSPSKPGRAQYYTIRGAIRGTAIISPVKTKSITVKPFRLLFWHNKWKIRHTTTGTTLTNRASTLDNPNPVISPAFVEAYYEVLESLLRKRRRQVQNEYLRTEFDYYIEEYDEEREMEPMPVRARETTPVLQRKSPRARRQRGRVVEFEDVSNRVERESNGRRPSERIIEDGGSHGGNLPPLLAAHLGRSENGLPSQSTLISEYGGNQPLINT